MHLLWALFIQSGVRHIPLTHNMNMHLLWALVQSSVSWHQETAVSNNSVYRESVSDSHNQFSCCIIDSLFTVGGSIQGQHRAITYPTRWWDQVPPWSCHLRVPAGHLKLVVVACSTNRHGGGEVHLGRGCVGRADVKMPSCKVRQVIILRCRFSFVYIYIRPSQPETPQLLPVFTGL